MRAFIALIAISVCSFFGVARAEQVHVLIAGKHAEASLVSHRGSCILVSVQHVFYYPGDDVQFWREGDTSPFSAEVMPLPSATQTLSAAGWASVAEDAGLRCSRSLDDAHFDKWTGKLEEISLQSGQPDPFRSNFYVLLRGRDGLVPVSVRLWGPVDNDRFLFQLDPNNKESVQDRAGISGSGVYVETQSIEGSTEYRLVGKVDGINKSGIFRAFRIESIANALGLVRRSSGSSAAPSGSGPSRGSNTRPVVQSDSIRNPPVHTRCDIEAANRFDPDRFPGIAGTNEDEMRAKSKVELKAILDVCKRATDEYPTSARLAYQEARMLYFLHKDFPEDYPFSAAIDALNKAQAMGHSHVQANIDNLLLSEERSCPDYETCIMEHRLSVDLIRKQAPDRARLGDFARLAASNLARTACPNWEQCQAEGADAMLAISDPALLPDAVFNLAWMYIDLNYTEHCGGIDACKPIVAEWLQRAVDANVLFAAYWQGQFLSRQSGLPQVCDTRRDCQKAAITALEKAGSDNEARGWAKLGDLAYEEEWREAIGCGDFAGCAAYAHDKYLAAAALHNDEGRIDAAYGFIFHHDEIGCEDADTCFAQARAQLENVRDKTHWYYLRRYAELLRKGPQVLSDICEGRGCDILSAKSYLAAHSDGDTSKQSPYWVAEYAAMDAWAFAEGNKPTETATGCDSAKTCTLAALKWYETAARDSSPAFLLDDWYDLIAHPPVAPGQDSVALSASLASWIEFSSKIAPGENKGAFSRFALGAVSESSRIDQLCSILEGACEARAHEILQAALVTDDHSFLQVFSSWIGHARLDNPEGPYADTIRQILLRSVPMLSSYNIYDIYHNGLFREDACPIGQVDCPAGAKRPVSDIIASEGAKYLPELHELTQGVGWRISNDGRGFHTSYHMSDYEDVLLTAQLLGSHDVPLGRYLLALHADIGDVRDIGWTEDETELYHRVASTYAQTLPLLPANEACYSASMLATINGRKVQTILSAQAEIDAFILALAYCGLDDLFSGVEHALDRDRTLARSVQSALKTALKNQPIMGRPFSVDGEFGEQSWAAVDSLHRFAMTALPEDRAENRISQVSGFAASASIDKNALNAAHGRLVAEFSKQ